MILPHAKWAWDPRRRLGGFSGAAGPGDTGAAATARPSPHPLVVVLASRPAGSGPLRGGLSHAPPARSRRRRLPRAWTPAPRPRPQSRAPREGSCTARRASPGSGLPFLPPEGRSLRPGLRGARAGSATPGPSPAAASHEAPAASAVGAASAAGAACEGPAQPRERRAVAAGLGLPGSRRRTQRRLRRPQTHMRRALPLARRVRRRDWPAGRSTRDCMPEMIGRAAQGSSVKWRSSRAELPGILVSLALRGLTWPGISPDLHGSCSEGRAPNPAGSRRALSLHLSPGGLRGAQPRPGPSWREERPWIPPRKHGARGAAPDAARPPPHPRQCRSAGPGLPGTRKLWGSPLKGFLRNPVHFHCKNYF
ncbi:uncharacterized protein LOC116420959 [Sarcophilus harrisii]|uniref:uncharacterized protein LOC116420959 n=1 Tax=Sarcophilus harrisii TaxID=9305 RepID=UPI001301B37A|nr:uncharacterized protein LOC116420959 [Sarcophilus harrisii]